ncbi:MAG: BT_3928 family protein [Niabella sp.]
MKKLVTIIRVVVGVLFIFSGLVKAIDPMGLSYKMQEYFDLWGMSALNSTTLVLSVLMNAFEIFAGVALLLGWKPKIVNWLLLLLIIFFTFLTGYSYLSGKFSNCGCFGDCIPITSKTSFLKDIILLVLILFLFFNTRYIKQFFSKSTTRFILIIATVATFILQWYVLHYLPVIDCLPYKVGNNIPQKMMMPANAVPDSTVINFIYQKNGQEVSFTADNFPEDFNDSTYTFIKREDKVITEGKNNVPEIRAFSFTNNAGNDLGQEILNAPEAVVLFVEDASHPIGDWQNKFSNIYETARQKNIPVYLITSTMATVQEAINNTTFKNITLLNGDRVTIRTAARTNPTVYLIKKGTIKGKWSYKNFSKALNIINK